MSTDFDLAGIGIGPSNLSLAALLEPHDIAARFFDARPEFQWHEGMMFSQAAIQVSYLKDLVTLADPTSRFSFISFLKEHGRLYRFINAEFSQVNRREFNQYLRWVCSQLRCLQFGAAVDSVTFDGGFIVRTGTQTVRARHLVVGTGAVPKVPSFVEPHLGTTIFHASRYRQLSQRLAGLNVAVIGGGQSGAEVVSEILSAGADGPAELWWISRRANFLPLDESPFTNELFTPSYSHFFQKLPDGLRKELVAGQVLASDGISPRTLTSLIRRLYELRFLDEAGCRVHPWAARDFNAIARDGERWALAVTDLLSGSTESVQADIVILCTGYRNQLAPCLAPLLDLISTNGGGLKYDEDYSIVWPGNPANRIYMQNTDRTLWGIADPNLSLMAWRSARIANSLLGPVYEVSDPFPLLEWGGASEACQ